MQHKRLLFVLCAVLTLFVTSVVAQESMETSAQMITAPVMTHPALGNPTEIDGATATLLSMEEGIAVHLATDNLEENHVYTLWVAMINNPQDCSVRPCPGPETLMNSDLLQTQVILGDSMLYRTGDRMEFAAFVPAGDVTGGWFDNGLTNPTGAEIHLVVMDHGELIPEMALEMLNTTRGGCTDESVPPPYPDSAKADGEAGPNTCIGQQLVVIQQ